MAHPLRINYPGTFYHVTSRGNERKDVSATGRSFMNVLSRPHKDVMQLFMSSI